MAGNRLCGEDENGKSNAETQSARKQREEVVVGGVC
jgi:hypothetical protein